MSPDAQPIRIGEIVSEAVEAYRRFFGRLFATAAAAFLVLDLVGAISAATLGGGFWDWAAWSLVAFTVGLVGSFWIAGALVLAVDDVADGRADLSIREVYDRVRPQLVTLIVAGILAALGIMVGLLLLIVPGLYLLVRWSVVGPVIVLERLDAGAAFSRSATLVRGHGWRIFWLLLVVGLLAGIAHGALLGIFAFLPPFWQTWIGGTIADSLVVPFVAGCVTVLYRRLAGRPGALASPS
jgi:glycerophosphoryl diester phosphodiesterase family protein